MLIVFRFFAGVAGSTVITIGGGTIGDMFSAADRAPAMSVYSIGPLLVRIHNPSKTITFYI